METVEAAGVSFAQNPLHLGSEAVVGRWLLAGVHLEILRERVNPVAEDSEQLRVRRLGGNDTSRQEDGWMHSFHCFSAQRGDEHLGMLALEHERRADLQDILPRARAVDEDAGVAHAVHDLLG
jgi:hypothetical protein